MSREAARGSSRRQVFPVLEYSKKESDAKAEAKKGWQLDISSAKQKLAEGNVKEAATFFNRYGTRRYQGSG